MAPLAEFKIYTGLLKAHRSPEGKMLLHGVASSTIDDLHGDTMQMTALQDMEQAANNNMTIFLNHSYNVPEDVGGSVEFARMVSRPPFYDLDFDISINDVNARAVQTFEAMERGTKLGISIGAYIPEGGARKKKDGGYLIDHVVLMEASFVGIPANPRSWVEYAVKSLKSADVPEIEVVDATAFGETEETLLIGAAMCPTCGRSKSNGGNCQDSYHNKSVEPELLEESHPELPDSAFACIDKTGRHYPHHTASGGVDKNLLRNALARIADKSNTQCGKGHLEAHAKALGIGDRDAPDFDIVTAVDDQFGLDHFVEDQAELESLIAAGGPASQEAIRSEPDDEEPEILDEDADGTNALLGDDVTKSIPQLVATLQSVTRELVAARAELSEAMSAKNAAEQRADRAGRERDLVLRSTKELIDKIADTPLVRRTAIAEAQDDFRARFGGIYADDFLKILENHDE